MYNPDEECRAMVAMLKKICEQRGVSPRAVAIRAGISTSTMSYIVKGKTNPQVYTVLQLCNALGVQIGDLFERGDDVSKAVEYVSYEEKELVNCYRCLSERKKEMLRIYVDMLLQYDERLSVNR